jgi:membrane associated rhomboid family serine protease
MKAEAAALKQEIKQQVTILGGWVALMWVIEILDQVVFQRSLDRLGLDRLGIMPRSMSGLWGILWAPFLHGSFSHLIANTVPFLSLGWLVMLRRTSDFWVVTALAMAIGGGGTWLLGAPNTVHIGASGLVFGYLGFLLLRGYFERQFWSICLSVGVMTLYGGLLFGVLPVARGVSWEGHLCGFLGGVFAAKLLAQPKNRSR